MRVFVYFDYNEYQSIRKWIQRHPEYEGSLFTNDGFYIAKFDIDATDPQAVAYFFHYFNQKDVEIFKPKKINPFSVLHHFWILSYRPFQAVPHVRPDETNQDEPLPPTFSQPPVRNPSLGNHPEGKQPSGAVLRTSGDTYEYYPKRLDYEGVEE